MKKTIMVILTIRACCALDICFAQSLTGQISGRIIDEKRHPVDAGTVFLYRIRDSTLIKSVASASNGNFFSQV